MAERTREEIYQRSQERVDSLFTQITLKFQRAIDELRARPPRRGLEDEFEPGPEIDVALREHEEGRGPGKPKSRPGTKK
jgi:hypothetical protein